MLKLKDTPTQPTTLTTEALEARVDELEFEKLQSETAQLMVSAEGYRNIGTVLNSTGVLSLEAAALAEVAEQLVGGGSSSLSDGLESHVVSGLEAEGKGEGFMAKAKEIGAKIMEKIKQMIAWITAKFQGNISDKAVNITESAKFKIDKFKADEFDTSDKTHNLKVYPHEAELVKNPKNEAIRKYLSMDPFPNEHDVGLYIDDDKWGAYLKTVSVHLSALASKAGMLQSEREFVRAGITLDLLPSIKTYNIEMNPFSVPSVVTSATTSDDKLTAQINLIDLIKVLPDVITEVEGVNKSVQVWVKKLKLVENMVSNYDDGDHAESGIMMKRIQAHVRILQFMVVTIPTEILRSYDGLVTSAKLAN